MNSQFHTHDTEQDGQCENGQTNVTLTITRQLAIILSSLTLTSTNAARLISFRTCSDINRSVKFLLKFYPQKHHSEI